MKLSKFKIDQCLQIGQKLMFTLKQEKIFDNLLALRHTPLGSRIRSFVVVSDSCGSTVGWLWKCEFAISGGCIEIKCRLGRLTLGIETFQA